MDQNADGRDAVLRRIEATAIAEIGATVVRIATLSDEAAALQRGYQDERRRAQRFMDQFPLAARSAPANPEVTGAATEGPRVDRDVVRRDVAANDALIVDSRALHGRLVAIGGLLRDLADQLPAERDDVVAYPADDLRVRQAAIQAREDEQSRLAREIHDGPAQVLANALFAVDIAEQMARRDPGRVGEELAGLRALLRSGVGEVRRFMGDLRPAALAERGLVAALEGYTAEYNRFFGKRFVFESGVASVVLTDDQQLAVFRIVQEALQNARKHAESDLGAVTVTQSDGRLRIVVRDQGVGFTPDPARQTGENGAGLPGMRERARLIGAALDIVSAPGAGTTVTVELPVSGTRAISAATNGGPS